MNLVIHIITLLTLTLLIGCHQAEQNESEKNGDSTSEAASTKKSDDKKPDVEKQNSEKLPPISSLWLTLEPPVKHRLLLGTFYSETGAKRFLSDLTNKNITANLLKMKNKLGEVVFVILSKTFESHKSALIERDRLKVYFSINAQVVNAIEEVKKVN